MDNEIKDSDIEALAEVIRTASWRHFRDLAKVILEAGYHKPVENEIKKEEGAIIGR